LQQAALSFEQQAAFALASQVAHSFFEAQDARSIDAAARRMEVRRIISVINEMGLKILPHERQITYLPV